ncbi:hypothetical protein BCU70_21370 [Vibrio sp. 10N.286.49.C2]|uniref:glycosyltransferase n=1 Tax=unclassified Vibrio TaxID=2614977 RepID=UPI000CC15C6E|nr:MULTISPECIES: glycosyltransferase [unclassified Vibrio]PMH32131.1 hypothetical protein BCU70_21370 [Vibrio sp. 10N.286.49.C2]PMH47974.1 hypothetical protein BCU66_21735 [Vibrio sp. 10N.286.49.B1]
MKNKIIYVGGFKLPDRSASALRAMEFSYLIKKSGYEPIIIGKLDDENHKSYEGIPCYSIDSKGCKYNLDIGSIERVISEIGSNTIHSMVAYNYPPIALFKLMVFCKRKNIQLIADLTEWYGWDGVGIYRDTVRFLATQLRMRVLCRLIKKKIYASSFLDEFYNNHKGYILPFCTSIERNVWANEEKTLNNDITHFVYAGSPGYKLAKDRIDKIISAFYRINDKTTKYKFNIVGISKTEYIDIYPEHEVFLKELEDKITFKGRLSHKETLIIVRNSDFSILIRPDNRVSNVGFSTKIVESLACETPVIVNITSDIEKYIEESRTGILIGQLDRALDSALIKSINMTKEERLEMANYCENHNPFYVENYISSFTEFLER